MRVRTLFFCLHLRSGDKYTRLWCVFVPTVFFHVRSFANKRKREAAISVATCQNDICIKNRKVYVNIDFKV